MQRFKNLLNELTRIHAVSGYEDDMTRFFYEYMVEFVDEVQIDKMGSVIAIKQGQRNNGPRVMFFAHMDEVGFMIRKCEKAGYMRLISLSGNHKVLPGQEVQIRTFDGQLTKGVVGVKSAHLTSATEWGQVLDIEKLFLYPVEGDWETKVQVGNTVTFRPHFQKLANDLVSSKALDNRAGCCVLLEAARRLTDKTFDATVAFVGTVQEEISCEGALAPAQAFGADMAIAVDGTVSYDAPNTLADGEVQCGTGPVITRLLRTPGLNGWTPNPKLALYIEKIAKEAEIPFQRDAIRGLMSDAKSLRLGDIPSALIGIPMHGKHSSAEIVSLQDIEETIKLVVKLAQHIDENLNLRRGY